MSQKFYNILEAQSGCFCRCRESNKSHWNVRCLARLIPDLPLWLGNPRFTWTIWFTLLILCAFTFHKTTAFVIITFRTIWFSVFFRCFMSNSGDHRESWNEPFIWTTGVDCSSSVNHYQVRVLIYSKDSLVILTCCWDWTCTLQLITLRSTIQLNTLSTAPCVFFGHFRVNFQDSYP